MINTLNSLSIPVDVVTKKSNGWIQPMRSKKTRRFTLCCAVLLAIHLFELLAARKASNGSVTQSDIFVQRILPYTGNITFDPDSAYVPRTLCKGLREALSSENLEHTLIPGMVCFAVHTSGAAIPAHVGSYSLHESSVDSPSSADFLTRANIVSKFLADVFSDVEAENQTAVVFLANLHDFGSLSPEMHDKLEALNVPFVCFCKDKRDRRSILIPDVYFIGSDGYKQLREDVRAAGEISTWETRLDKAVYRGASTGGILHETSWLDLPRARLSYLANSGLLRNFMDVGISYVVQIDSGGNRSLVESSMREHGILKEGMNVTQQISKYKVLIDIDGNSNSWEGAFWKMASNSLTVKIECDYVQWWYHKIVPWEHYVPVKCDFSDLSNNILWALNPTNAGKVAGIIDASTQLIEDLTYARVVKEFSKDFTIYARRGPEHPLAKLSMT